MPSRRLVPVRCYFEPAVFERIEQRRKAMRRMSRNRFIEDLIVEGLERGDLIRPSPSSDRPRRRTSAA